jgi:hypothetical protein
MRKREILPGRQPLVSGGKIRFGTFDDAPSVANLADADGVFSRRVPAWFKRARLKEWQALQFRNDRYFGIVALFDAKVLGLVQIKVYDLVEKRKHVFERQLPGSRLKVPQQTWSGTNEWSSGGEHLRIVSDWEHRRFDLSFSVRASGDHPALSADLKLDATGVEPVVVSMPFGPNRGMFSHKAVMRAGGTVRVGDHTEVFDPGTSFALLDDHKGYYPHVMQWDWVTTAGIDGQGRRIGVNLTRNQALAPETYNENVVWIDGRRSLPARREVRAQHRDARGLDHPRRRGTRRRALRGRGRRSRRPQPARGREPLPGPLRPVLGRHPHGGRRRGLARRLLRHGRGLLPADLSAAQADLLET